MYFARIYIWILTGSQYYENKKNMILKHKWIPFLKTAIIKDI